MKPSTLIASAVLSTAALVGARAQTSVLNSPSAPPSAPASSAPLKINEEVTVPKGYRIVRKEIGVGTQNAECPSNKPIGPEADLLNPDTKAKEGIHFKRPNSSGPEWLFSNSDYFQAHVHIIGKPSHVNAIPTLELDVDVNLSTGDMGKVTKIFRLETDGDSSGPCEPKKKYNALYVFAAPDLS